MTRNVDEVHVTNWTDLAATAPVPQWSVDIVIRWTTTAGSSMEHVETVTFPNILAGVPLGRLKGYMEEIILRELRIQQGVDVE